MNLLTELWRLLRADGRAALSRRSSAEEARDAESVTMPQQEEADASPAGQGQPQRGEDPRHSREPKASKTLQGDRGIVSVNRQRPLQHRVTQGMAMLLMGALGIALLSWYYLRLMAAPATAQRTAQQASAAQAQGELALPALGPAPPMPTSAAEPAISPWMGEAPVLPDTSAHPALVSANSYGAERSVSAGSGAPSPTEGAIARRLAGPAFTSVTRTAEAAMLAVGTPSPITAGVQRGDINALLIPTATPAVQAQVLPTQRLLLPKGAFIDCTLETAIDSSLPGLTTCITATDTFSADGTVVLLERGTKLVGETRGEVQLGSARLFVLWTEARTPTGVVVPLASPGTDELGRSGLTGQVDRHFIDRFGAAILISVIDGVIQAAVQSRSNAGTVMVNTSSTQDILTEVLKSTINIPPTIHKQNGDRIQILVARDLDFRSVYELRTTDASR